MQRLRSLGVMAGLASALACGGPEPLPPATLGAAGAGGSLGTLGTGGGGGLVMAFAGMTGIGAFAGHLNVHPPATVNLQVCGALAGSSADFWNQCSSCCTGNGFVNHALFDGKCACGSPTDAGATLCSPSANLLDCTTCCSNAGYRNSHVNLTTPDSCRCYSHYNDDVCSNAVTDATPRNACAVCCINAGYINSGIDFGCACSDG